MKIIKISALCFLFCLSMETSSGAIVATNREKKKGEKYAPLAKPPECVSGLECPCAADVRHYKFQHKTTVTTAP